MNQRFKYKKKLLAVSISAVTASFLPAQEILETQYDSSQMDEIVVTGIRASLQRSMDIKRDSKGVVDGISAEDIGNFFVSRDQRIDEAPDPATVIGSFGGLRCGNATRSDLGIAVATRKIAVAPRATPSHPKRAAARL